MRNLEKRTALDDAAQKANIKLEAMSLDVEDPDSINNCIETIMNNDGRVDLLVNNAGAGFIRTTEHATEEEIQWVMNVNFMGVVLCTKAVLPNMRKAKSGHIINISSIGGLVGQPFNEIYCAAKFAVEGYTESMASYIQPSFYVKFTVIEPGGISSEFANNVLAQFQRGGGMKDDEYRPILEKYTGGARERTNGVFQTPEEVAKVIVDCFENPTPPRAYSHI